MAAGPLINTRVAHVTKNVSRESDLRTRIQPNSTDKGKT